MTATGQQGRWGPFELFVVRPAGWGFELVDSLSSAELYRVACRLDAVRLELDQMADGLRAQAARSVAVPPGQLASARTALRAVKLRRAVPASVTETLGDAGWPTGWATGWNDLCAAVVTARQTLASAYPAALAGARDRIAGLLTEERFMESALLVSPQISRSLRSLAGRPPAGLRPNQNERRAALLVQRLAAKCETNAFVGPIAYGSIGSRPAYAPPPSASRRAGMIPFRIIRRLAAVSIERDQDVAARPVRLGPAARAVPEGAFGRLVAEAGRLGSWRAAARTCGVAVPGPKVVRRMHEAGVAWVVSRTVPACVPDALDALEEGLALAPDPWLGGISATLRERGARFASGSADDKQRLLAEVLALVADEPPSTGGLGDGHYADRAPIYEEDLDGRFSMSLRGAALEAVSRGVAPALDIALGVAAQAQARVAEAVAAGFAREFGGRTRVPLAEFLPYAAKLAEVSVDDTPLAAALTAMVADRWDGRAAEVELDVGDITARTEAALPAGELLLASPDLLLAARDAAAVAAGDFDLILGEVHWGLQLVGNLCCFVPDQDALAASVRAWVSAAPAPGRPANVALSTRYGKLCYLQVFDDCVELTGPARPAVRQHGLADLEVDRQGRCFVAATGERLLLLMGDGDGRTQTTLGPPAARLPRLRCGAFTPRIRVGRTVLQRACWEVAADAIAAAADHPDPAEGYGRTVGLLNRLGVPRRVFASFPDERKPLYVDLASVHLVGVLTAMCRGGLVRLVEMLPGPAGLWCTAAGQPRVVELRLAFARTKGADL